VNCHAEMSADIASIPPWKVALLQRKRLHDKEPTGSNVSHATPSGQQAIVDSALPAWKRDILIKKQNPNSSVFLAKSGHTDESQSNNAVSSVSNGHVHSVALESQPEPELDATVVDIDINDTIEDQPVEERLLPIHQNPILRLDLKKRTQSSSSSSTRNSVSSRVTSGSHEHSSTISSVSSHAPVTPDTINEEVFGNDNDSETDLTYGKGFVHKLLMKFSHLSSDQTANNQHLKPRFHSLVETSKPFDYGLQKQLSRDLESIGLQPPKPSFSMAATKYHSVDDLCSATKLHTRIDDSDSVEELDIVTTNDIVNGECGMHVDHGTDEDDNASKRNSSCAEIADELPFANIVSNARSLFESLAVHSASQKMPVSQLHAQSMTSGYSSYVGTLERSHQLKRTSAVTTQEVSAPKKTDQSHKTLTRSLRWTEVSHSNGTPLVADDGESRGNSDVRIETDASEDKKMNSFSNGPSSSTYTGGSVLNQDVNITATSPPQPASVYADSSMSKNSLHSTKSSTKEKEQETILSTSTIQSKTPAAESGSSANSILENRSTTIARRDHVDYSSLSSQFSDNKENMTSQPVLSVKKPAPSRPGKLLIRPASNLVAAKTSTEYLELTKFNDVRKGEFAPPVKKERTDLDAYDDDIDKPDGAADDVIIIEQYDFTGAGIVIGRSLLTKTNRNRSVNR